MPLLLLNANASTTKHSCSIPRKPRTFHFFLPLLSALLTTEPNNYQHEAHIRGKEINQSGYRVGITTLFPYVSYRPTYLTTDACMYAMAHYGNS